MSYIPFSDSDTIISSEAIVSALWSNNTYTLGTSSLYTSSTQEQSYTGDTYLNVYNLPATASNAELQFALSYGHVSGSGSAPYNTSAPGLTPTSNIYTQCVNTIYGDETAPLAFGGVVSKDVYVINVARSRYKESIKPGSFNLVLKSPSGSVYLTDNSKDLTSANYVGGNRYYTVVSGSNGNSWNSTEVQTVSGSYGMFFPDLATVYLNPRALSLPVSSGGISSSIDETASTSYTSPINTNNSKLFGYIYNGNNISGNSQETVTSKYFAVNVKFNDCNYTTNPSVIDNNGNILYTTLVDNPETYVTGVGLYNELNELMGIAKLSKPLKKSFINTLSFKVKLST